MDLGELIAGFFLLTLLGILIAFNPSLIIVNFLVVLKSKRPLRDALILISGVMIPLLLIAVIASFWLEPDSAFDLRGFSSKLKIPPVIDLIFGLALLIYASSIRFRQRRPATKKSRANLISKPASIFGFAFLRSCLSITNLLAALVIAKILVVSDPSPLAFILGIAWAFFIGATPLLAAPYMQKYQPDRVQRARVYIDRIWYGDHSSLISIALAIIGLGFLVHGALNLN